MHSRVDLRRGDPLPVPSHFCRDIACGKDTLDKGKTMKTKQKQTNKKPVLLVQRPQIFCRGRFLKTNYAQFV